MACLLLTIVSVGFGTSAWAGIQDDRYDGNIFALYAGNGSLVPPKVTLAKSLRSERPTLLTFYIDDSQDCKQFSAIISQIRPHGTGLLL
jgi:hypothetical protein